MKDDKQETENNKKYLKKQQINELVIPTSLHQNTMQ
jgi:hypothetical protein